MKAWNLDQEILQEGIIYGETLAKNSKYSKSTLQLIKKEIERLRKFQRGEFESADEETKFNASLETLKTKSMAVKNPIIYLIAYVVFGISYIKRKMVFNRYRNNNLKMTERTYSAAEEISENDPKEDIYCLGSDQTLNGIRRLEIFDNISNPMIKVSYASSFGRSIFSEDELKRMKRSLVDFQLLSCREKTGLEIMNHMQIKNVNWNIDPAFLMTADEWRKHMKAKYTGGVHRNL